MLKVPFTKSMNFAPVPQEDDDLLDAIDNDIKRQDDKWQLKKDDIDGNQLSQFWDSAVNELENNDNDFSP